MIVLACLKQTRSWRSIQPVFEPQTMIRWADRRRRRRVATQTPRSRDVRCRRSNASPPRSRRPADDARLRDPQRPPGPARPPGIAPGFVQGNLAILPAALASDFMRFCQLNPKPCPLLAVGAPGDWRLPSLGGRSRHPHRPLPLPGVPNGELIDEPTDIDEALARRSGDLRARLLVLVRGSADRGRHRAAPHHQQLRPCRCTAPTCRPRRPARSTARWWCRCGR